MIFNTQSLFNHHTSTHLTTEIPQTCLELSSNAFNHNAAYYKNIIGQHRKLAAVIKGNGYGHGLHQMAYLCEQTQYIDWLLVAQLSEAINLQNITKPILVLGYSDINPALAINKNIHFMVDNIIYAEKLNSIGKKYAYQLNVHIKIDTGLSRMGISAHAALSFIQQIQKLSHIKITGIYSHFSASDSNPAFTQQQMALFNDVLQQLDAYNISIENIHMSNSAAISILPYNNNYNFFRVGIGLYGLGHDREHLKPVMTWKTHITHIKTIPTHSLVSYCGEYQTTKETRIALLPIGYYDGYKFNFSNKSSVLINGAYAPVLGRIAMNVTIVDVTDIIAHVDDEVILMGPYPSINAHDLAMQGSIANVREILVGINSALTRIIVE